MSGTDEFTLKIVDDVDRNTEAVDDNKPEQPNAASVEQFQGAQDEQKRVAYEDRQVLQFLFGHAAGRRFLWGILKDLHPFETKFGHGHGLPDPNATFYELGKQQHGLALYQVWMMAHPAEMILLHRENDVRLMPPVEPKTRKRKKND